MPQGPRPQPCCTSTSQPRGGGGPASKDPQAPGACAAEVAQDTAPGPGLEDNQELSSEGKGPPDRVRTPRMRESAPDRGSCSSEHSRGRGGACWGWKPCLLICSLCAFPLQGLASILARSRCSVNGVDRDTSSMLEPGAEKQGAWWGEERRAGRAEVTAGPLQFMPLLTATRDERRSSPSAAGPG